MWKICEKGNLVQFGFLENESFIMNKKTEEKVFMKRQGGSYVLEVELCDPATVFYRRGEIPSMESNLQDREH